MQKCTWSVEKLINFFERGTAVAIAKTSTTSKAKRKKSSRRKGAGLLANERKWGVTTHKQGWTYVPNILLEHQAELGITPTELNVILTIMKHWWDRDSLPWPSVTKVAESIGRHRSTVQRRIRDLEGRGLVKRIYRKDARKEKASLSNEYDFTGLVQKVAAIAKIRQKEKTASLRTRAR